MHITDAQRQLLKTLWFDGPLSRSDLSRLLAITPNAAGGIAAQLQQLGLVSEMTAETAALRGRPKTPLQIEGRRQSIVGLAVSPGRVEACRFGFAGHPLDRPHVKTLTAGASPLAAAARLLPAVLHPRTLLIALTVPGLVDQKSGNIMLSSAFPDAKSHSVLPVLKAAAGIPLIVGNNLHAAAAGWTLSHRRPFTDDSLLVNIADGQIGAAILINGKPNRGCILGANELGHTRLPMAAPSCYCGGRGCIERIFSSGFLAGKSRGASKGILEARLRANAPGDRRLGIAVSSLAMVLSNAINFLRPANVIIATPFAEYRHFISGLTADIRRGLLPHIGSRVEISVWNRCISGSAHLAAWLGIAGIVLPGWSDYEAQPEHQDRHSTPRLQIAPADE